MITQIETEAAAIIVEIKLIVLIDTTPLGGIDGNGSSYASIGGSQRERGFMTGAEIRFRVDAIDCSLGMERITRLVHPYLQRQAFAFWAHHIDRVVF